MDRARKKRTQTIRLIIVEIIMVIIIAILVVFLTFIAMGYNVNSEGKVDQSGLVQIESLPTNGTIKIDESKIFSKTNTSKLLPAEKHTISITKDGFDTWTKEIDVKSGKLHKLDYVRLFKLDRVMEKVRDFKKELAVFTASPDGNTLLYAEKGSKEWHLMTIRSDNVSVKELKITDILDVDSEVFDFMWSSDGNKVLFAARMPEKSTEEAETDEISFATHKILLDVKNIKNSIDLTNEFQMDFAIVKFASDSGDKLMVLEDGNLRSITVSSKTISKALLPKLEWFDNDESRVLYVSAPEKGEKKIGYYREGDNGAAILKTIPADTKIKTILAKYLDYYYFGFMENNRLYVYRANTLPTPERGLDKMEKLAENDTGVMPNSLFSASENRFMIAQEADRLIVFDGETNVFYEFTIGNTKWNFADKHLISTVVDDKTVIYDFDGTNRRELSKASNYGAIITANNRWIYYVCAEGCLENTNMKAEIRREKIVN